MQAKAKRLARFKVELEQPVQSSPDIANKKISATGRDLSVVEKQHLAGEHSIDVAGSSPFGNALADHEGLEPPSVIIGLCPDMCPGMFLSFSVSANLRTQTIFSCNTEVMNLILSHLCESEYSLHGVLVSFLFFSEE